MNKMFDRLFSNDVYLDDCSRPERSPSVPGRRDLYQADVPLVGEQDVRTG